MKLASCTVASSECRTPSPPAILVGQYIGRRLLYRGTVEYRVGPLDPVYRAVACTSRRGLLRRRIVLLSTISGDSPVDNVGTILFSALPRMLGPARTGPVVAAFLEAFQDTGWIEGRDFSLEARTTAGDRLRMDAGAREVIALKVDVIVTSVTGNAVAVKRATSEIPIVMITP